jgi:hypothetical protein
MIILTLFSMAVCLAAASSSAAYWPTDGYDAQRTRRSTFKGPRGSTLATQWSFTIQAYNFVPPPVVGADGTIFVCDFPNVYAFRNSSGQQLWSYTLPGTSNSGYLTITGGNALLISDQSALYALNGATGALLWTAASAPGSATVAADDTIYVCSNRTLYALDGGTGATLWTYVPPGSATCNGQPTIGLYGSLYLAYFYDSVDGSALICVNTTSHTELWQRDISGTR